MKSLKKIKPRKPLNETVIDVNCGLNAEQILERKEKNYVNNVKIGTSKSILSIILSNTCSFFNFLCILIFIWILSIAKDFNDLKNCTFMVIIFINIAIGIIQEIRAKMTMDKLSLMTSPKTRVLREGEEKEIHVNEILKDDIMILSNGNQISSDAILIEGNVEVNESLVTGESDAITKKEGDTLLSGSFIVSGRCKAQVMNIGEENYIQKLAIEAKQYKRQPSELLRSLNFIMKVLTCIILVYSVPTFLNSFNASLMEIGGLEHQRFALFQALGQLDSFTKTQIYDAYVMSVNPTATMLIGMIPAGLFLLTSLALAVGVLRLSKKKALVQGLYSIETLARVDMLCLDKTGTITDGTMSVNHVVSTSKAYSIERIGEIIRAMELALEDNNATSRALTEYFTKGGARAVDYVVPFSSERKCSMVKFSSDSLYILGAPEYVMNALPEKLKALIEDYQAKGLRCLLLGASDEAKAISERSHPEKVKPVAVIAIEDNVKEDAIETIKYFKENDVDVRVISGDNPVTVSEVAKRVGINNADKYISLQNMSDEEIMNVATDYTVFGRVNPAQKKLLVKLFKSKGRTVAMTGDGINDILALKEADCSIAMANGSEATRNVAQLVLLDSNFGSMPSVVGEGRRVVNNIQRASSLFLTKTLYTFVLQLVLIFMQISMPLDPIGLSFISLFGVGLPSFVLALEPNNNRIKGKFVSNVLKKIIPASLTMDIVVVGVILLTNSGIVPVSEEQQKTLVMLTMFIVYLFVIYDICKPINLVRGLLITGTLVVTGLIVLIAPFLPIYELNIFNIARLDSYNIISMLLSVTLVSMALLKVGRFAVSRVEKAWATAKVEIPDISETGSEESGENVEDERITLLELDEEETVNREEIHDLVIADDTSGDKKKQNGKRIASFFRELFKFDIKK